MIKWCTMGAQGNLQAVVKIVKSYQVTWQVHRSLKGNIRGKISSQLIYGAVASEQDLKGRIERYELTVCQAFELGGVCRASQRFFETPVEAVWQDEKLNCRYITKPCETAELHGSDLRDGLPGAEQNYKGYKSHIKPRHDQFEQLIGCNLPWANNVSSHRLPSQWDGPWILCLHVHCTSFTCAPVGTAYAMQVLQIEDWMT